MPLLDERTVSRVVWLKNAIGLRDHLKDRFGLERIPSWMGGTANDSTFRLYNDFLVKPELMNGRFN